MRYRDFIEWLRARGQHNWADYFTSWRSTTGTRQGWDGHARKLGLR